jgi:hypothetical protein
MNFRAFLKSEVILKSEEWRYGRSLLLCVTCIIGCSSIFAQDSTYTYKNTVSIEALGLGRYGSLEYEMLLRKGELVDYYAAAGFAMVRFFNYKNKFKPDVFIPIMGRAVFGQKSHHLELSFGQVIASYSTFSVAKGGESREFELSLAIGTAYRFHTPHGRWQYRAIFYKILDNFNTKRIWIGVAAGYRFNVKSQ